MPNLELRLHVLAFLQLSRRDYRTSLVVIVKPNFLVPQSSLYCIYRINIITDKKVPIRLPLHVLFKATYVPFRVALLSVALVASYLLVWPIFATEATAARVRALFVNGGVLLSIALVLLALLLCIMMLQKRVRIRLQRDELADKVHASDSLMYQGVLIANMLLSVGEAIRNRDRTFAVVGDAMFLVFVALQGVYVMQLLQYKFDVPEIRVRRSASRSPLLYAGGRKLAPVVRCPL